MLTSEEIKELMRLGTPVYYQNHRYTRISAYIYRVGKDARTSNYHAFLQVELLDEKSNSVIIADPKKISLTNKSEGEE